MSSPDDFVLAAVAPGTVSTTWHVVTVLAGIRQGETVLVFTKPHVRETDPSFLALAREEVAR